MIAYKIFEVDNKNIKTLFHGWNGSRTLPIGEKLYAIKKQVTDGSRQNSYLSGWHVFLDYKEAEKYLPRFTKPRTLDIIPVKIDANTIRPKPNASGDVYLADWILI